MEQFNKAQVIMLPTKFTHSPYIPIIDVTGNNQLSKNNNFGLTVSKFYHLYITSDDKIKKGDWFIVNGVIKQCVDIKSNNSITWIVDNLGNEDIIGFCKKIIATTDTLLTASFGSDEEGYGKMRDGLPQISQQFIEKYIEEYNKGNIITDVLVEYENSDNSYESWTPDGIKEFYAQQLKINPKDNTINIKLPKESWDKKDLDFVLNCILNDVLIRKRNKALIKSPSSNEIADYIINWKKENL